LHNKQTGGVMLSSETAECTESECTDQPETRSTLANHPLRQLHPSITLLWLSAS